MIRRHLTGAILVGSLLASLSASLPARAVGVGDPAPDFSLPALDDRVMITLADHRGKVVYLDFWSSWCLPCRISLPLLSAMRDELFGESFEIVAIDVDRIPKDGRDFLKRYPASYPVASDSTGATAERYNLVGMPTSFIIDREGIVRHIHTGFEENDIEEIRAQLEALIGEN